MTWTLARCFAVIAVAVATLAIGAPPAGAQPAAPAAEPEETVEGFPRALAARVRAHRAKLAEIGLAGPEVTRGVASSLKIWTVARLGAIKVCQMPTIAPVWRKKVRDFAMEWARVPNAHIPLDFGADPDNPRECRGADEDSHIRIAFERRAGRWSLVGMEAVDYKELLGRLGEPSMNLGGIERGALSDSEIKRIVLHEFGHALGLEHEHQNPLARCQSEFDWAAIERALVGPPPKWDRRALQDNMAVMNEPGLIAEKPDPASIMHYALDARLFKSREKSTCYRPANAAISKDDANLVAALYPRNPDHQKRLLDDRRRRFAEAMRRKSGGNRLRSDAVEAYEGYLGKLDP